MFQARKLIPFITFTWALGLLGCGATPAREATPKTVAQVMRAALGVGEQDEQQGEQAQTGDANNAATCDAIHAELVAGREALQATPEWQALAKTPEYAAVENTAQHLQEACEGHDANNPPSDECAAVYTQFKADLVAMKTTPEWAGVETTPAYTLLKDTYDQYHAAGCGAFQPSF